MKQYKREGDCATLSESDKERKRERERKKERESDNKGMRKRI